MLRVEDDQHPLRVEPLGDRPRDLFPEPFLQLRARRDRVEHPGQRAQADQLGTGCVRQVRDPDEGQQVVLADGAEADVPHDDELAPVAVLGVDGALPGDLDRVGADAVEELRVCLRDTGGRAGEFGTVRVVADAEQQFADRCLHTSAVEGTCHGIIQHQEHPENAARGTASPGPRFL